MKSKILTWKEGEILHEIRTKQFDNGTFISEKFVNGIKEISHFQIMYS